MTQIHILVAEDDAGIRMGLVDTLESENYRVTEASDGLEALSRFRTQPFDLILLDIMMPGKSGYDVCQEIRAENKTIPIIMLTAKGEEIDKVVGLKLGADDYITKPFGIYELLARINAVLRRSRIVQEPKDQARPSTFSFGEFTVNARTFQITDRNSSINISQRELQLIQFFYQHPGEVLSRDDILNEVWGIDYFGTTRTLDQHIANLRKKIEADPSNPSLITTVHGVGYRYNCL